MHRAKQSGHSAKVVLDANRLRTVKMSSRDRPLEVEGDNVDSPTDYVQMDALPEGPNK